MFVAALFSIAKKWKQSKCTSVDGWINGKWLKKKKKKVVEPHSGILYATKKGVEYWHKLQHE